MARWFYAVMSEGNATWWMAVRARDVQSARRQLSRLYPRATVFEIRAD